MNMWLLKTYKEPKTSKLKYRFSKMTNIYDFKELDILSICLVLSMAVHITSSQASEMHT